MVIMCFTTNTRWKCERFHGCCFGWMRLKFTHKIWFYSEKRWIFMSHQEKAVEHTWIYGSTGRQNKSELLDQWTKYSTDSNSVANEFIVSCRCRLQKMKTIRKNSGVRWIFSLTTNNVNTFHFMKSINQRTKNKH